MYLLMCQKDMYLPMDHLMDLLVDHLMVQFMEPLMELLKNHLMDKPTHLMGPGINLCISHLIMAL